MAYSESYFKYLEKKNLIKNRFKRYNKLFAFINQNSDIKNVLEIGCGDGHLVEYLNSKFEQIKAIGIDIHDLKLNIEYYKIDILDDIEFKVFKDKNLKFDLAICRMVLEHIDEPFKFLTRINELLPDKGYIYIEVPSFKTIFLPGDSNFYGDYTHVKPYTKKSLTRLINDTGFKLIKIKAGDPFFVRMFGIPYAILKGIISFKKYHFHRAIIRMLNADPLKIFAAKKAK